MRISSIAGNPELERDGHAAPKGNRYSAAAVRQAETGRGDREKKKSCQGKTDPLGDQKDRFCSARPWPRQTMPAPSL
jgi:hypothetical protein